MKFTVTIGMKNVGEFEDFFLAFKLFFEKITETVGKGTSYQFLETACWIELESTSGIIAPLMINKATDLAYDCGILFADEEARKVTLVPPPTDDAGRSQYFVKLVNGIQKTGLAMAAGEFNKIEQAYKNAIDVLQGVGVEGPDRMMQNIVDEEKKTVMKAAEKVEQQIIAVYTELCGELAKEALAQ